MDIGTMSFPENKKNIQLTRKYAKEKELLLEEDAEQNFWKLKDTQSGEYVLTGVSLWDAYEFISGYDY